MDLIRILTEFTEDLGSFEHLQSLWNVWNVQCFPSLVLHYVEGKFPTAFLSFLEFPYSIPQISCYILSVIFVQKLRKNTLE